METTKEAIIKRSIKVLNRKIKKIRETLDANPIGDLIQLRIDFQAMIKKCNNDWKNKELRDFVESAAIKEKEQKALAEKQQNTSEMISELVKLEMEVSSLNTELFYMSMRR